MNKKHNKQEERKIMNYISKIIGSTYKYIRQLCGFENDTDVPLDSKSSKVTTKVDSTGANKAMVQATTVEDEMITTWPMQPAAKRKIAAKKRLAAKRKKAVKKTTSKSTKISTKKPIKKAVKKT